MSGLSMLAAWAVISFQTAGLPVAPAEHVSAQGRSKAALQRAYGRLCSPPLGDLDFVLSDLDFKLTRRFTEYSGDVSGRMLGALIAAGPPLGQDAAMVGQLGQAAGRLQKADGHFGVEQDLIAGIKPERDMPILWGNGRLLLALVHRYQQTRQDELLKIARGIGDYVVNTRPYFGKPENLKLGGAYAAGYTTCYPSLIEGMALLSEATQNKQYLEEAKHIARIALMDTSFEKHHSHGRLAAYLGMLQIDRLAGLKEFLPAVQTGVDKVIGELMLPTGGVTEIFDRTDSRDEGCSEADWVMVNVLLWQATGQTRYLDVADFTLRNHVLASQFPNGGFGHHGLRVLASGAKRYPAGGFANVGAEAYWCCSMHGTQLLGDLTRWAVVGDTKAAWVTWLADAQAKLPLDGRLTTIDVVQTAANVWKVGLEVNGVAEVPLRLRVPGWTDSLLVDGRRVEAREGWAQLSCKVDHRSSLEVRFPLEIRLQGAYAARAIADEPQRIAGGADLFCLADVGLAVGFLVAEAVPTVLLAGGIAQGGESPVVVEGGADGGERILTGLVPMSARPAGGCRWLFNIRRVEVLPVARAYRSNRVPIELMFACDGACEVSVNGISSDARKGWGENGRVEVYVDRGPCRVTVKASSQAARPGLIGCIRAGEHLHITDVKNWSSVPSARLLDLGGFGEGPWKHLPAEFAGTGARWIWPDARGAAADKSWVLSFEFQVE